MSRGECVRLDIRNAIWDAITAAFTLWVPDDCRLVLVQQNPIYTAVDTIICFHIDCGQACGRERLVPNACNRGGNRVAGGSA